MKKYVLDSSIVVKWFNKEETHADKACRVRDDYFEHKCKLIIPELLLFEVSNALKYSGKLTNVEVKEAIESILDMDFEIKPVDIDVLKEAVDIAFKRDITIYDAYFLAMALSLDYFFLTADEKMFLKVKDMRLIKALKGI